jgi:hypothetical protein
LLNGGLLIYHSVIQIQHVSIQRLDNEKNRIKKSPGRLFTG